MKLLDLSQFEKIAQDKHIAKMRHRDGHEMTIIISKLKPIHKEQLKRLKMSDGGGVHEQDEQSAQAGQSQVGSDIRSNYTPERNYKLDSDQKKSNAQVISRAKETHYKTLDEIKEMRKQKRTNLARGGMAHYDDGTPNAPVSQSDASQPDNSSGSPDHSTTITINAAPAQPAAAAPSPPPMNAATQMAQTPITGTIPKSPAPISNVDANGNYNPIAAMQNTQTQNTAQGNINAAGSAQASQLEQQKIAADAQTAQVDQQNLQNWNKHVGDFQNYIQNNPIDEKAYWNNKSEGSKVATGLGIILGGIGGRGTSNAAMDFLQKNIQQNIDGQKSRMDQQNTIYGAYKSLYGDSVAANNATKASMLDIYAHKANQIADNLGTQSAHVNAALLNTVAAQEKSKLAAESAVDMRNLQGAAPINQKNAQIQASPEMQNGAQEQNNQPSSRPSGSDEQNYNESNGVRTYPILVPGAVQKASGQSKVATIDQPKLHTQLTKADQVDKVLNGPNRDGQGGIHDLLQNMYQDIGQGSQGGSLEQRVKGAIGHIPYVGDIGEKGANAIYTGEGYKDYSSKRTGMIQDLSTALSGLVAPTDIIKLVDDNLPIHGDTPEDVNMKEKQIYNGIIKAVPTDELENANILAPNLRRKR